MYLKAEQRRPTIPANEASEQATLMAWAGWMSNRIPELGLLFHIPNGGSRNRIEAAHLKEQGVKAGVSDLMLPVARGKYHGLFIEMKAGLNRVTEKQRSFLEAVQREGYAGIVCYSANEAVEAITEYLQLRRHNNG